MTDVLGPRAIPTSLDQVSQLWRYGINYPLFVPNIGPGVVELLQRGAIRDFLLEVQRRAELGSAGAASLLAYLSIQGISLDPQASSIAVERCHAAATAGDGYAQFVFAWIRKKLNDDAGAFQWMMKAATKGLFLPAFIDIGRFLVASTGSDAPDSRRAIEVLWQAHRLGHRFALVYIARLMARGNGGWMRQPIGILLWIPALIRAHFHSRFNPLSEKVFVVLTKPRLPLLKGWPLSA